LLADPVEAARAGGVALREPERDMLAALPRLVLETMIRNLQPERHRRPSFLRKVAAAVTGTVLIAAADCAACGGIDGEDYWTPPDGDTDAEADGDAADDATSDVEAGDGAADGTGGDEGDAS
jgi:hypothetical protein